MTHFSSKPFVANVKTWVKMSRLDNFPFSRVSFPESRLQSNLLLRGFGSSAEEAQSWLQGMAAPLASHSWRIRDPSEST
jgi:hypothetical protein